MSGWICIHRSLKDHWLADDNEKLAAWVKILMTVNWTAKKVLIGNTVVDCNPGQSLLSLDNWAKLFGKGWNKSKVRRYFLMLKTDTMIDTESVGKTTRLTVCNWGTYQESRNADETQTDTEVKRKRNGSETQTTPTKQGEQKKQRKQTKKVTFVPPTLEEVVVYCAEKSYSTFDAKGFWLGKQENGWMNKKVKVVSWKGTIDKWNHMGYSQVNISQTPTNEPRMGRALPDDAYENPNDPAEVNTWLQASFKRDERENSA